jgi:phosphate transport system substrate-binding protein
MRRLRLIACVAGIAFATLAQAADERLAGSLTTVGSDTASALITRWAAAFRTQHPAVRIQVQAAGSASAPIALIEGAADLGSMSRPMTAAEIGAFHARFGYAPLQFVIAHDAIAVFVHPDNPLDSITLPQLDAIYSTTNRCGYHRTISNWRDLGVAGLADLPLLVSGRDSSSGTYALFREIALCEGRYQPKMIAWPGNGAVVATVSRYPEAIGYAGLGYVNGLVKPLPIALRAGEEAVAPTPINIAAGRYPLARALYVYMNRRPRETPAALPAAFVAYMLSDEAQALAPRVGLLSLTLNERRIQRALLDRNAAP